MRKHRLIFLLLSLLFTANIVHSQETTPDPHSLFEMLARVPDTAAVHEGGMVIYADMRAAEVARGLPPFRDARAWVESSREVQSVWMMAAPGFAMIPDMANYLLIVAEDMPRLLGIDVFTIDRTLYFGQPPQIGNVLQGDFDPDAIVAALTQRDYTSETQGAVTVLCPSAGCDSGQNIDPAAREPGNPFGGSLGRQEPLVYAPGYVFNSADYPTLNAIVDAANGEQSSLQDNLAYQAAASMITTDGLLRQAMFVEVGVVLSGDPAMWVLGAAATSENIEMFRKQYDLDEEGRVPVGQAAELMVIADIAQIEGEQQIGRIVLVYDDEAMAQAAAAELDLRLSQDIPLLANPERTLQAVVEDRGGSLQPTRVTQDEATGKWVLTLDAVADLPQGDAQDANGRLLMSGLLGRLWVDMVYRRDLLWLA